MSNLVSQMQFELDETLRVVSRSADRQRAALYLCRAVRKAALAGSVWNAMPIGLDWLIRNRTEFKRYVPDASPLFRSFIEEPECICTIIRNKHLLQLVAPARLEAFVREVLHKYPMPVFSWLGSVRTTELPAEKQALIMIDTITAALQRRDDASFQDIADFFQSTPDFYKWGILSQEQFYDMLKRCAEMCPWAAVYDAEKLVPYMKARLTTEQCKDIFAIIPGCGRWSSTRVEDVAALPYAVQCRLVVQALDVSPQILEHVATIPNGREAVIEYLKRVKASFGYDQRAGATGSQHASQPGADALLQVLKATPGRRISEVSVKLPVL